MRLQQSQSLGLVPAHPPCLVVGTVQMTPNDFPLTKPLYAIRLAIPPLSTKGQQHGPAPGVNPGLPGVWGLWAEKGKALSRFGLGWTHL